MNINKIPNSFDPNENAYVSVTPMGNITEVVFSSFHAKREKSQNYIIKIDKDTYYDIRTKEIKSFSHADSRAQSLYSLSKSIRNGRNIINTNCADVSKCRFITLTYKENMKDIKKLYRDFDNFNRRLRSSIGQYRYICAVEPQARGAWHIHALLLFDNEAPYIDPQTVSDAWKKGFVKVNAIDNIDNIGAYLTSYLTNLEFDEEGDVIEKNKPKPRDTKSKKKGARLYLYPRGMNIFRYSKGIIRPKTIRIHEKDVQKIVKEHALVYEKTVELTDYNERCALMNYRVFNSSRNKSIDRLPSLNENSDEIKKIQAELEHASTLPDTTAAILLNYGK